MSKQPISFNENELFDRYKISKDLKVLTPIFSNLECFITSNAYKFKYLILKLDVEDIEQEIRLYILSLVDLYLSDFPTYDIRFGAFFNKRVKNFLLNKMRESRSLKAGYNENLGISITEEVTLDMIIEREHNEEFSISNVEGSRLFSKIKPFYDTLSNNLKSMFNLFFIEGLNYVELGNRFTISKDVARQRIIQLVAKLNLYLEKKFNIPTIATFRHYKKRVVLNQDKIKSIIKMYKEGNSFRFIAKHFNITHPRVITIISQNL